MLKNLLMFLVLSLSFSISAAQKINGAGATFPYPIYSKWFAEYRKIKGDVEFNYQSIGSGGGIKQVLAQTVDFGATDAAMTDAELKQAKYPITHIPTVIGAVTVAYNASGVPANLMLDGQTIAAIFQGKISKWNDPVIAKLNPKAKLPATDILVVRRADGSGTTAVFTEFLAAVSPEWKSAVGSGKNINWPAGIGAKGNEGVTAMIAQTDGAIGYVELAYAINNKLNMASVKNAKGEFISPSVKSITAAGNAVKEVKEDMRISIINSQEKGAYPISAFTYILLPQDPKSAAIKETKMFLQWALTKGQSYAANLHYAPLPKKVADKLSSTLK